MENEGRSFRVNGKTAIERTNELEFTSIHDLLDVAGKKALADAIVSKDDPRGMA